MRYEDKIVSFEGAYCAVVTPFSGGEVDFDSFGVLLDRQIDGGVSAVEAVNASIAGNIGGLGLNSAWGWVFGALFAAGRRILPWDYLIL